MPGHVLTGKLQVLHGEWSARGYDLDDEVARRAVREFAGTIPCELCAFKGGANIDIDGGCRHRPSLDGSNDVEVFSRLDRTVSLRP